MMSRAEQGQRKRRKKQVPLFDKNDDRNPQGRDDNSKKKKMEEDLDDEDHEIKKRKELEMWEGLENSMRTRIPRGKL